MSYTLDQFAADCRAALLRDPGPAGRELVRQYTAKACTDSDFIAKHLGPDADADRKILYEDPELHFCILAHVYKGARNSPPHDHGPSWAIYSQVAGVTEMTDWRLLAKPANGQAGKVEKVRTYRLTPGIAHRSEENTSELQSLSHFDISLHYALPISCTSAFWHMSTRAHATARRTTTVRAGRSTARWPASPR